MANVLAAFKRVTTFIIDLDGVLTDGSLLILENGLYARKLHVKDSFAMQMAVKKGYRVAVIAGGVADPVKERLLKLGIRDVEMPVADKTAFIRQYISTHQLDVSEVLYIADDLPDVAALKIAGMPCCPADAAPEVLKIVKYVASLKGGEGCVREVIEKVLKLNDHWTYEES